MNRTDHHLVSAYFDSYESAGEEAETDEGDTTDYESGVLYYSEVLYDSYLNGRKAGLTQVQLDEMRYEDLLNLY
jgi:hypothetical protein